MSSNGIDTNVQTLKTSEDAVTNVFNMGVTGIPYLRPYWEWLPSYVETSLYLSGLLSTESSSSSSCSKLESVQVFCPFSLECGAERSET